jgi:hypothetical protein
MTLLQKHMLDLMTPVELLRIKETQKTLSNYCLDDPEVVKMVENKLNEWAGVK